MDYEHPTSLKKKHLFLVSNVTESLINTSRSLRHGFSVHSMPIQPWGGRQEQAWVVLRSRDPGV